jgi:hypothetical protein
MKRIISLLLVIIMVCSLAACANEDNKVYDDYSCGLDENGYYIDLDKYAVELPNLSELKLQVDDLLKFGLTLNTTESSPTTVDAYLENYATEVLTALGMATKTDTIEHGDVVTADIRFFLDGKELEDYATTNSYKANKDGDSIIASFIGKKHKDTYEVEYTFAADDKYHPSKTANVKIEIKDVLLDDAINKGVVEANADKLTEYIGTTITDKASFVQALRPRLASVLVTSYLDVYLNKLDFKVPSKLVDYEMYRLKARLQQIGYTYSKYLEDAVLTDKEVREYCTTVAKSNLILMLYAKEVDMIVTEEEVKSYYSSNFEYIHELQGMPYMKLDILRDTALYYISGLPILMDGDNVIDVDALFPETDIPGVGADDKEKPTDDSTTEPTPGTTTPENTDTPANTENTQSETGEN